MREVEITTQHLIRDGFGGQPAFKAFVAEEANEIIAAALFYERYSTKIAKKKGHRVLAKMSKLIAADEMRHHIAYK